MKNNILSKNTLLCLIGLSTVGSASATGWFGRLKSRTAGFIAAGAAIVIAGGYFVFKHVTKKKPEDQTKGTTPGEGHNSGAGSFSYVNKNKNETEEIENKNNSLLKKEVAALTALLNKYKNSKDPQILVRADQAAARLKKLKFTEDWNDDKERQEALKQYLYVVYKAFSQAAGLRPEEAVQAYEEWQGQYGEKACGHEIVQNIYDFRRESDPFKAQTFLDRAEADVDSKYLHPTEGVDIALQSALEQYYTLLDDQALKDAFLGRGGEAIKKRQATRGMQRGPGWYLVSLLDSFSALKTALDPTCHEEWKIREEAKRLRDQRFPKGSSEHVLRRDALKRYEEMFGSKDISQNSCTLKEVKLLCSDPKDRMRSATSSVVGTYDDLDEKHDMGNDFDDVEEVVGAMEKEARVLYDKFREANRKIIALINNDISAAEGLTPASAFKENLKNAHEFLRELQKNHGIDFMTVEHSYLYRHRFSRISPGYPSGNALEPSGLEHAQIFLMKNKEHNLPVELDVFANDLELKLGTIYGASFMSKSSE